MNTPLEIGARWLDVESVELVARGGQQVCLDPRVLPGIKASRDFVEAALEAGEPVYGINTGFGALQHVDISPDEIEQLQHNLLVSHSVSVGEPLGDDIARAMMLLRANSLAQGHSGIRLLVIERILDLVNSGFIPLIPRLGSVGASGDLSPLSHMALPLIGLGQLGKNGVFRSAKEVLEELNMSPLRLQAKEGLALNNGTQFMAATAALLLSEAERMASCADLALACSLEAFQGRSAAFHEGIHRLRRHPGQMLSAANVRRLTEGSNRVDRKDPDHPRVQDSYSVRCGAQVHGASRDTFAHARLVIEREMNAVTDNPLVFPGDETTAPAGVLSGGNFHGEPIAFVLDFMKLAIAELGSISERRTAKILDASQSYGLPPFLVKRSGLNSGMMVCQYTSAALVAKNKTLAHPDSLDSIPTSANQEDHVSMGANSALHAIDILDNVKTILSIELLASSIGNRFRDGNAGAGTTSALAQIEERLQVLRGSGDGFGDRDFRAEFMLIRGLLETGVLMDAAEESVGTID
jgi:histidine ammonia-lyase